MLLVTKSSRFPLKHIYNYLLLVLLLIPLKKESNQTFELYWGFTNLDMVKFYFSKTFQIPNHDLGLVFYIRK